MNILNIYANFLKKHPILGNACTSCFLFGLGDVLCQTVFEKQEYSVRRTINQFGVGILGGPIMYTWYSVLLPKIVKQVLPRFGIMKNPSKFLDVFVRVCFNQTCFASTFTCYFFLMANFLKTGNFHTGIKAIKEKFWQTYRTNLKVWPAAMFIGFYAIPPHLLVVWSSTIMLFWNVCLSYIQNTDKTQLKL